MGAGPGAVAALWVVEQIEAALLLGGEGGAAVLHRVELAGERVELGVVGLVAGECDDGSVHELRIGRGGRQVGCGAQIGCIGQGAQPGRQRGDVSIGHLVGIEQRPARLLAAVACTAIPEQPAARPALGIKPKSGSLVEIAGAGRAAQALVGAVNATQRKEAAGRVRMAARLDVAAGASQFATGREADVLEQPVADLGERRRRKRRWQGRAGRALGGGIGAGVVGNCRRSCAAAAADEQAQQHGRKQDLAGEHGSLLCLHAASFPAERGPSMEKLWRPAPQLPGKMRACVSSTSCLCFSSPSRWPLSPPWPVSWCGICESASATICRLRTAST
ncbi:hypothetical protein ASC95_21975 [Pelomonas sp. Root1217]|nr:hypothetical protein [Pelomonas sp. Root1217]KQV48585.1 hypothetical protein ASC95_21975 [Pelomonas sp. Root1217]